jgi:hypothetical protein
MEDKDLGKIIGKALIQVYHKTLGTTYSGGYINYTIAIYTKDGRYKYEITDFHHTGQYVGGGSSVPDYGICEKMINTTDKTMGVSYQKIYNQYLSQMDSNIRNLIADLNDAMSAKAIKPTDNDW